MRSRCHDILLLLLLVAFSVPLQSSRSTEDIGHALLPVGVRNTVWLRSNYPANPSIGWLSWWRRDVEGGPWLCLKIVSAVSAGVGSPVNWGSDGRDGRDGELHPPGHEQPPASLIGQTLGLGSACWHGSQSGGWMVHQEADSAACCWNKPASPSCPRNPRRSVEKGTSRPDLTSISTWASCIKSPVLFTLFLCLLSFCLNIHSLACDIHHWCLTAESFSHSNPLALQAPTPHPKPQSPRPLAPNLQAARSTQRAQETKEGPPAGNYPAPLYLKHLVSEALSRAKKGAVTPQSNEVLPIILLFHPKTAVVKERLSQAIPIPDISISVGAVARRSSFDPPPPACH
ncbi:hypothetical protein B0H63DRAFT_14155 [Podospora didyma]|uniref:Uncharacterized protein n=1 Tax=Podospora didyma TaxID=330526 RepID=A0AAE0U7B5_9PEZI|nr:hypothetical protein B0H63DRAFT_14155 [Podospora didyma]